MGIDFTAKNKLEQAIQNYDIENIVYSIVEKESLTTLAPASILGNKRFSDEIIFTVLLLGITNDQLKMATNGWFWGHLKVGERLRSLIYQAVEPLPQEPTLNERKLIKAIIYHQDEEIIKLIKEEKTQFTGFAFELLLMLPELSKEAVLTILQDGISAKLKAIILGIFLERTNHNSKLENFTYDEKIMYANLMIKIILGKKISVNMPWYPEAE